MAKSDFGSKQELQEYLAGLKQIDAQYKILNAEAKKLADVPGGAKEQVKQQLRDLQIQHDTHKEIIASIKFAQKELDSFNNTQKKITTEGKKNANTAANMVNSFGELEGLQVSITNQYGRQSAQAKSIEAIVDKTKAQYNGITSILNSNIDIQGHQRDIIDEALDTYKNFPVVLNGLEKQLKRNEITAEQFYKSITSTNEQFRDLINQMDDMVPGVKEIKEHLDSLPEVMDKNVAAAAAMKRQFEGIDAAQQLGGFAFGGIPGASAVMSNAAQMRKDSINGVDLKTLTLVGALIGLYELAASLEGKSLARAEAQNEIIAKRQDMLLEIAEATVKYANKLPETKALLDYTYELKGLQNQFAASAQTALFGGALGEMPYVTEQMQLAGIGAESVVSAMHDLSKTANIGIFPKLAANAAVFAKKMGISTSELGTQVGLYRQLDKVGGEDAMAGAQYQIRVGTIDPTTFSSDMTDSAKLAMYYNIKSYQSLVKQVQQVRLMGGSFAEIAEDGKNMVLNYKDSIKSEMQLSAMLGERVDLSEVRSLIAASDIEGAQRAFNATGLAQKARAQGMFSVDMLQKAVGSAIQMTALAAPYEQGSKLNVPTNAGFLQSLQDAMKNLKIATAYLDVDKLVDTAMYTARETKLLRGDRNTLDIAGQIKQNEAASFFRKVIAMLEAPGGLAQDAYDKMKDQMPASLKIVMPNKVPGSNVEIGQLIEKATELVGAPLYPDIPGRRFSKKTGKQIGAGYDYKNHPLPYMDIERDFAGPNNRNFFGNGSQPSVSTGKGIDYLNRVPDKQQEIINVSKVQNAKLEELNSKNETSIQLLKSLRDLTAIMMDPERKEDFNVQLNMDGRQIHNVLIRSTKKLEGTQKGSGMSFATK